MILDINIFEDLWFTILVRAGVVQRMETGEDRDYEEDGEGLREIE
jgi:hypothetical protein